ncbi:hypothetical protein CIB95_11915 [Lottiidibacillus patelloidae]|uniref:Gram-positive cocci surface proteins LPxTG domain-containing protein n=1 Tax=Lottiidibacillus patelloidae TaxID=2670334 RepID=A0A263BRZ8_9BACI|nr:LPXTG cell wall anchor domain-containing protein [Lottiidibacillus patelloidae]OZM56475.1 hypothetical protein CIB95_11915 [Lottiidibacillus patelloidae]
MRRILFMFGLVFLVLLHITISPVLATADTNTQSEIKIKLLPESILFTIENMKPGDSASRTIAIENSGEDEFKFNMQIEDVGSEKLFNELMIEISDAKGLLYSGKMTDFDGFEARNLKTMEKDEFYLTIHFPEHLGNEYQGLEAKFNIVFIAQGLELGEFFELPNTATNYINYMLGGVILLLFGITVYIVKIKKGL